MTLEEYEREQRSIYAAFADNIASIIGTAIYEVGGFNLQQMQARAKDVASLRKKLSDRNLAKDASLTENIKDLAGCRAIFYTNSDVDRFLKSGLVEANFEIIERKLHHPQREIESAANLYMANHYVLQLNDVRAALPEYRRFVGLKCELQVQTILNHSWAATAHDTIYKKPDLSDFGSKSMEGIERRLTNIAKRYLVPAGYHIDRVVYDFDRLLQGKALLDENALQKIIEAPDNNERAEALETFIENVLPYYDDIPAVFGDIVEKLVDSAKLSKDSPLKAISTPFGELPGKSFADVLGQITDALKLYRYIDVDLVFDALLKLYAIAEAEEETKPLVELAEAMSKHELEVWKKHGPAVQAQLVDRIASLSAQDQLKFAPIVTTILQRILGTEIEGSTWNYDSVTLQRGVVSASDFLAEIRAKAINILESLYSQDLSKRDRISTRHAFFQATRPPTGYGDSDELAFIILNDTTRIIDILTHNAAQLPFDERQTTEDRVFRRFDWNASLPPKMAKNKELVDAQRRVRESAVVFRDAVNSDEDFVIYKILVGFESVYPPAWEEGEFGYKEANAYREEKVGGLLASVRPEDGDVWFERLNLFAATESNDMATFPVFGNFIRQLGKTHPEMVGHWIDDLPEPLARFLPGMLAGLMQSDISEKIRAKIDRWVEAGHRLSDIAWYLRSAEPLEQKLLSHVLNRSIIHSDDIAIYNCIDAAIRQFDKDPDGLIDGVFLPAIEALADKNDTGWVNMMMVPWLRAPLVLAMDETQARRLLAVLVSHPNIDHNAEYCVAAIAENWPDRVFEFLSRRLAINDSESAPESYTPFPHSVNQLREPLSKVPGVFVAVARDWYSANPARFRYGGAKFLASVYADLTEALSTELELLLEDEPAFVLSVLSAFDGKAEIYPMVQMIISTHSNDTTLLGFAHDALNQSGVVSGEFGFADLYSKRRELMLPWLEDGHSTVRKFAEEHIEDLDRFILAETRQVEARIVARKLEYDRDIIEEGEDDEGEDAV